MIAGWLLYCIAVSALLGAGAAAVDAVFTARGRPARWVWAAAMGGSLLIPAAAYLQQRLAPAPTAPVGANEFGSSPTARFPSRVLDAPPDPLNPLRVVAAHRPRAPEPTGTERVAMMLGVACVVIAALRVMFDSVWLYRGRRRWIPRVIDGVPVLLSDDLGPAIVGLLEPKIVLPRWALTLEPHDRDLMLAHEREHVRRNDGRLTTAALMAVMCMPWNPAMWYALRRLRTAIEVDCDRRVLRAFPDIRRYGHLLVDVAQRAVGSSLAIAGFSEGASPVARRIRAMTGAVRHGVIARDVASGAVGTLALVGSLALLPPEAAARSASLTHSASVTAKYVGDSIADREPSSWSESSGVKTVATFESSAAMIAAARDLPVAFSVVEMHSGPAAFTDLCPGQLRDDRDGTALRISRSSTGVASVVQRGDTAWARVRSVGYYMVRPDGRYGVSSEQGQTLRVGCGGSTHITVAGRPITRSGALSTLDTPADDRARRIGDEVVGLIGVEPLAVDLYKSKLHVVVGDTVAVAHDRDAAWGFMRATFARASAVLGRSVMPETLTVSLRRGRDSWITMYHYTSSAK